MRIALINLGRRGAGPVYALQMGAALSRKVQLLCLISSQAENRREWRASGLNVREVQTYSSALDFVPASLRLPQYARMRSIVRQFQPDLLYYPMSHPWHQVLNALLPRPAKLLTVHDPVLHEGERHPLAELQLAVSLRQASRVIVLSQSLVGSLARRGFPRDRVDVIPIGELSVYGMLAPGEGVCDQRPPTLLFFGRILKYKGLGTLLEAFAIVQKTVPDARLLIVGSGDVRPYRPLLRGLHGVTLVNRWIPDSEVAGWIRQGDVVVLPYDSASQSGVIPIAYTLEKPVVATAVGGVAEQVQHGRTGFLVPPRDPRSLADACCQLLANRDARLNLGRAARDFALKSWGWDSLADRLLASGRAAIAGKAPARGSRC